VLERTPNAIATGVPRLIFHVDMDAFFASVEQRDHPELRGRPVLVGGSGRRGVVAAASYEARVFGCRSAMPGAVARRLCPHAVFAKPRFDAYCEASQRVFAVFDRWTPLVQPLSVDEAFLDLTGQPFGLTPTEIAQRIKREIRTETDLPASVGVAPNKFLAKLASDLDKPDGLVVITPDRVRRTLDPLPVARLPGVGPAAERRLERLGVRTIADLRAQPRETLRARFGEWGDRLADLARGLDDRPVTPDRDAKSVGHEQTFGEDLTEPGDARAVLLRQTEDVARRLRTHGLYARGVTLKIRFGDFTTITRAHPVPDGDAPTHATGTLWNTVRDAFERWRREGFRPVRLIGVTATHLTREPARQLGLFAERRDDRPADALDRTTDAIEARFGKGAIRRAASLGAQPDRPSHGPHHKARADTPGKKPPERTEP